LATGRNPLLERAAADSMNVPLTNDTATEMVAAARPVGARRAGFGPPPTLTGVAQVVGLALGSPEFQRR
ncbi:MAG: hypothetical protein ACREOG_04975, partial [Gemmatimonadaceae bacterium]